MAMRSFWFMSMSLMRALTSFSSVSFSLSLAFLSLFSHLLFA
uniref:Cysteine-rich receptor-like protein kinase 10 n=1 Tax=Rhizophora mucronata TaxID=61149 RepID=A0A2P2KKW0_RHIMU